MRALPLQPRNLAAANGAPAGLDVADRPADLADAPAGGSGDPAPALAGWVEAVRNGQTHFAGAFGNLARGKQNWRAAAMYSLAANLVLGAGFVGLATQTRITPYVVLTDKLGRTQAWGPADRIATTDPRISAAAVAQWVHDVKGVVADPVAEQDVVQRAYAYVSADAAAFLNAYFASPAHDPRVLAKDLTRVVEVTSVLRVPGPARPRGAPEGPATWKLSWTETDYPRGGGAPTATAWEGYITTQTSPPQSVDRVSINPLGLFVTSVQWAQTSVRVDDPGGAANAALGAAPSGPPNASPAAAPGTPVTPVTPVTGATP